MHLPALQQDQTAKPTESANDSSLRKKQKQHTHSFRKLSGTSAPSPGRAAVTAPSHEKADLRSPALSAYQKSYSSPIGWQISQPLSAAGATASLQCCNCAWTRLRLARQDSSAKAPGKTSAPDLSKPPCSAPRVLRKTDIFLGPTSSPADLA